MNRWYLLAAVLLLTGCSPEPRKQKNPLVGTWESTAGGNATIGLGMGPVNIGGTIQSFTLRMELGRLGEGKMIFLYRGIVYDDMNVVAKFRWHTERKGGKTLLYIDKISGDALGPETATIEIVSKTALVITTEMGNRMFFNRIADES